MHPGSWAQKNKHRLGIVLPPDPVPVNLSDDITGPGGRRPSFVKADREQRFLVQEPSLGNVKCKILWVTEGRNHFCRFSIADFGQGCQKCSVDLVLTGYSQRRHIAHQGYRISIAVK